MRRNNFSLREIPGVESGSPQSAKMEIPVDVRWRAVEPGSKRNFKHEKTDCVFVEIAGSVRDREEKRLLESHAS